MKILVTGASGFLAQVCRDWEQESLQPVGNCHRISLRMGVIIGKSGGALAKMLPFFKMGLGGPLGTGQQWMSWIHLNDVIKIIIWILNNPHTQGIINVVSPQPVTNLEFTQTLGKSLHRPAIIPAPAFVFKALLGDASSVLLDSQRVVPSRLQEWGYPFEYSNLSEAIKGSI